MTDADFAARLATFGIMGRPVEAPFSLWRVCPMAGCQDAQTALLGEAERDRAARFRTAALARRYRVAHAARRLLVEAAVGIAANRQSYAADTFGRPFLPDAAHVRTSISYGGDDALVAVCPSREIGVDIEQVRVIDDAMDLAEIHYTRRELDQLRRSPVEQIDRAFLTIWVRKEACSKALGQGLAIAPASFECGAGCGPRMVSIAGQILESDVIDPKDGFIISWSTSRSKDKS